MKKNKTWFLAAILLSSLTMTSMTSCSDDDDINNGDQDDNGYVVDLADIEVVEEGDINPKEFLQDAIQQASSGNGSEEDEAYEQIYRKLLQQREAYEAHLMDSLKAANPGNSVDALGAQIFEGYGSGYYILKHPGTLADGTKGTLSTLIVYPKNFWISIDAKMVILGCHYTVTGNHEVPSNYKKLDCKSDAHILTGEWVIPKGNQALLIMPDYEGYGATKDRPHPYLSREVQARQCMESVAAAVKWFTKDHKEEFKKNCKMISIGYSQGGAVSAASYRYYLEHKNEKWLKDLPPYVGAVCGDGPYDPMATIQTYISTNKLYMPVAPALVLNSLCKTDPEMIQAGGKLEDFCTPGFINSGIFDRIDSKTKSVEQCDNAVFSYAKAHPDELKMKNDGDHDYLPTDQAFNAATIAYIKSGILMEGASEQKLKALKHCLEKNQLMYGDFQKPSDAKFTFFHSFYDEVVPYSNLETVIDSWGTNSIRAYKYDAGTKLHSRTGAAFYLNYSDSYVSDIRNGKWKTGLSTVTGKLF